MRTSYFLQVTDIPKDQQVLIARPQEAFVQYFEAHSKAKAMDFDGGGFHAASRPFQFNDDSLWA